jgi:hypothetical protein
MRVVLEQKRRAEQAESGAELTGVTEGGKRKILRGESPSCPAGKTLMLTAPAVACLTFPANRFTPRS